MGVGRLENFIPNIKKFTVAKSTGVSLVEFSGYDPFTVESEVIPFLKQVNGHLSLREIFLFLNEKGESFSIDKSLAMLQHLANNELMVNSSDFFEVLHGAAPGKSHRPKVKDLDQDYFKKERLISLIQKTTLFLQCDRAAAEKILEHSELKQVAEGARLIKKGTKSSFFYVLLTGEAGVYKDSDCLASLGPLSIFGESAAIFDKVRNADVVASESSWLLKIDANKIVDTSSPDSFEAFKGLKSRLILNQTLSANPLFKTLPTDVMQFFISKCRIEKYGREQMIFEQGAMSGDFYFVLQGSVSVIKDGIPVTSLGEGNHFGEIAAIFNQPRSASVLAETICTFLVLNQKALFEVLASHFRLAIDIERTAKMRKKSTSNVLQIFDQDCDQPEDTAIVSLDDLSNSQIEIDQDFFETSKSNFDLELVDFSNPDEEAS